MVQRALVSRLPLAKELLVVLTREEVGARKGLHEAQELARHDVEFRVAVMRSAYRQSKYAPIAEKRRVDEMLIPVYHDDPRPEVSPPRPPARPVPAQFRVATTATRRVEGEEAEIRAWLVRLEAKLRDHAEAECVDGWRRLCAATTCQNEEERSREERFNDETVAWRLLLKRSRIARPAHTAPPPPPPAPRELSVDESEAAGRDHIAAEEAATRQAGHDELAMWFGVRLFAALRTEDTARQLLERLATEEMAATYAAFLTQGFPQPHLATAVLGGGRKATPLQQHLIFLFNKPAPPSKAAAQRVRHEADRREAENLERESRVKVEDEERETREGIVEGGAAHRQQLAEHQQAREAVSAEEEQRRATLAEEQQREHDDIQSASSERLSAFRLAAEERESHFASENDQRLKVADAEENERRRLEEQELLQHDDIDQRAQERNAHKAEEDEAARKKAEDDESQDRAVLVEAEESIREKVSEAAADQRRAIKRSEEHQAERRALYRTERNEREVLFLEWREGWGRLSACEAEDATWTEVDEFRLSELEVLQEDERARRGSTNPTLEQAEVESASLNSSRRDDAGSPREWYDRGIILLRSENDRESPAEMVHGERYTAKQSLARSIELDPNYAEAWHALGLTLGQAGNAASFPVLDRERTAEECIAEALKLRPEDGLMWIDLAQLLDANNASAEVDGVAVTAVEAYARAAEFGNDDEKGKAFYALLTLLDPESSVHVGGKECTAADCGARYLRIKPTDASGWYFFGTVLDQGNKKYKIGGETYSKASQCYAQSLRLDPKYRSAWWGLASSLPDTTEEPEPEQFEEVGGVRYDAIGAAVEALALAKEANDMQSVTADHWFNLGLAVEGRGPANVATVLGRNMSAYDCYLESLAIEPKHSSAWYGLAGTMPDDAEFKAPASVGGGVINKVVAYVHYLELEPDQDSVAWYNLGVGLGAQEQTTMFNGEELNEQRCYIKACEIDRKNRNAWYNLAQTISEGKSVVVSGKSYSRRECLAKGK